MSDERPKDDGAMFFVGFMFDPHPSMKQSDLNRILVYLLRRIFQTGEGEPFPVEEQEKTMLMVVEFIKALGLRLDEEAFASIPEDLRRHFIVLHRDGVKYRYGNKPRFG